MIGGITIRLTVLANLLYAHSSKLAYYCLSWGLP